MIDDNHITVDKMELGITLAHKDTENNFNNDIASIYKELEDDWTEYTPEAQTYFNIKYDYYMTIIEQCQI